MINRPRFVHASGEDEARPEPKGCYVGHVVGYCWILEGIFWNTLINLPTNHFESKVRDRFPTHEQNVCEC